MKERTMDIALWIVQILLALAFGLAGVMKLFQYERARQQMKWVVDVPRNLVALIGAVEILGALGLILPLLTGILPWLTPLAALGLGLVMVLAGGFHLSRHENPAIIGNIVLLLVALFVAYGRFVLVPA
jgi:uncharacterized membrane protein YphA (DoxX/SURF4 family)